MHFFIYIQYVVGLDFELQLRNVLNISSRNTNKGKHG